MVSEVFVIQVCADFCACATCLNGISKQSEDGPAVWKRSELLLILFVRAGMLGMRGRRFGLFKGVRRHFLDSQISFIAHTEISAERVIERDDERKNKPN